ncbi:hypothetical protein GCM10011512_15680 [Tersicoccus solisilvae]|uniref:DUF3027 domain-containing protein n=1 Tax=Tersicoccus solisilvae TaxID=1882339 RepID=A0ABQ1P3G5_9MICC|nr:DUF3027 domain-containing protein [Tersicoccus solisilvae]GGC89591.1 hypothetical protein GCM10011512_15680 [Tersicoccus solisilvae]
MPESSTTEPTEPETAGAATTESTEPVEPETTLPEDAPVEDAPVDGAGTDVPAARPVRRRAARPDAVLIAARDVARAALADIARDEQLGEHAGTTVDGERLVTHSFASVLPGYQGWNWFVVLARVPRSRAVTVCEIGLAPGQGALLAPPWIPWADRLRPEDHEVEGQQPDDTDATAAQQPDDAAASDAAADTSAAQPPVEEGPSEETRSEGTPTPDGEADAAIAADDAEIVDDDATLLSRPEADGRELPGEEDDEPEPDLSAEAEGVRTEEDTEDAVADGAEEATEA